VTLGDLDESKWEPGLDGQPRDPWQEQICLPVVPQDAGGEVFRFVARSATALRAVRRLLGVVRYHPNAKTGYLPVIQFGVAIYHNKTFKRDTPKPSVHVVDWIAPEARVTPPPSLADDMNDELPV
jgi:hypothetical protein